MDGHHSAGGQHNTVQQMLPAQRCTATLLLLLLLLPSRPLQLQRPLGAMQLAAVAVAAAAADRPPVAAFGTVQQMR